MLKKEGAPNECNFFAWVNKCIFKFFINKDEKSFFQYKELVKGKDSILSQF